MKLTTLRRGMTLYHGTAAGEDFEIPRGPAWFTNSIQVARYFSTWHGEEGQPRILTFKLSKSIRLPRVTSCAELGALITFVGGDVYDGPCENAGAVCDRYNGWIVPNNYPEGADIMICKPDEYLSFQTSSLGEGLLPACEKLHAAAKESKYAFVKLLTRIKVQRFDDGEPGVLLLGNCPLCATTLGLDLNEEDLLDIL